MEVKAKIVVKIPVVCDVTVGTDSQAVIRPLEVSVASSEAYNRTAKLVIENSDEHMRDVCALYWQGQIS